MLLTLLGETAYRPTRDLDFAGYGTPLIARVRSSIRDICTIHVDDGISFDSAEIDIKSLRGQEEYDALRVRFGAELHGARIPIQIDIGFGNAIQPPPAERDLPTLLDGPPPRILVYPLESVVAEKLHIMVHYGEQNSRYKDFYDLHALAQHFSFDGEDLTRSIAATFQRRTTEFTQELPVALNARFYTDAARATRWRGYKDRNRLSEAPQDFAAVGQLICSFLTEPWRALTIGVSFERTWRAGGPWQNQSERPSTVASGFNHPTEDYRSYPAYKDSGVELVGKIPSHWEIMSLKRLMQFFAGWTPPTADAGLYGGTHFWANISDLGPSVLRSTENTISDDAVQKARMKCVMPGTLLFSFKLSIGLVSIAGVKMYTNEAIAAFIPSDRIHTTFLYWAAPIFIPSNAQVNIYGALLLNKERIENAPIPWLPNEEQRVIAAFLDRETAKIDALVAKKERLIELLQEKRTALITRAVTKGLDPNVPMTDSGVEWIGEIPSHWEAKKLNRLCLVQRGASPRPIDDPAYFDDDGEYAWVRIADVTRSERYLERTTERLSILGRSKSVALEPGELFVSIAATVGKPIITRIRCCIHDGFVYFVGLRENREYLFYLFSCGELYKGIGKLGTQLNLNTETIGALHVPVPTRTEQESIRLFLDRETSKIDALISKVHHAIYRLIELRTALISAAVTGKIDVRETAA